MDASFIRLLIQDYLLKSDLPDTLLTFQQESKHSSSCSPSSSPLIWAEIAAKLQLPYDSEVAEKPVLENLLAGYLDERASRIRTDVNRVADKLLSAPSPSRAFNRSYVGLGGSAPSSSSSSSFLSKPAGKSSSSSLRFDLSSAPNPVPTEDETEQIQESLLNSSSLLNGTSTSKKLLPTSSSLSLKNLKKKKTPATYSSASSNALSAENWLPFSHRMESVARGMRVANANWRSTLIHKTNVERLEKEQPMLEYLNFLAAEKLDLKKRATCGCCEVLFPSINLVLRVPKKAILDVRKHWETSSSSFTAGDKGECKSVEATSQGLHLPRMYDEVNVCLFCAQFFHDQVN